MGGEALDVPVYGSVDEALDGVHVLVDYTSHTAVKSNTLTATRRGVAAVIGSSGATAADYAEIDRAAREHAVGVISSGDFSLTAPVSNWSRFACSQSRAVPLGASGFVALE